ncbi:endonuclease/exonuclease/phosphatase family protein [Bacteroidota bacterium]
MKKLKYKILLFINITIALALGISYLTSYINPGTFWIPALFGLIYPLILVLNLIFIVYWIFKRKIYLFISLIMILLGAGHLNSFFSFHSSQKNKTGEEKSFKILSYNTRLFDIWNWSKDEETPSKIVDFIQNENAEIICLQEFLTKPDGLLSNNNLHNKFGKEKYIHIVYSSNIKSRGQKYGIATYSQFPIINKGEIRFDKSSNIIIFSDLIIDKDTVRIYNCHLASIHFRHDELSSILNNDPDNKNKSFNNIYNISKKLKNAYVKRADQSEILKDHIKNSPFKVFVCGDFNDTPYSYTYRNVKGRLHDAFNKSGLGFGTTYRQKLFSVRIDYILHDKTYKSYGFKNHNLVLSDHFPVSCSFINKNS